MKFKKILNLTNLDFNLLKISFKKIHFIYKMVNDLIKRPAKFIENGFWTVPIPETEIDYDLLESNRCVSLFDQNGYDLTHLEQLYARYNLPICDSYDKLQGNNSPVITIHRSVQHTSIQTPWYVQHTEGDKKEGYVLNHSFILQRFGYQGEAKEQLLKFAKRNPLIYKVINITPKWGIDFSLDFVKAPKSKMNDNESEDSDFECFELLHYEHDSFNYKDANEIKYRLEGVIETTNFDEVAIDLINKKSEWINLEFFEQSDWKCKYFNIPNERFKMVTWQN